MPKFVSVILARGGSKGIPNKNLTIVNKKPLLHWTIEASQNSKYISDTFVSSDSPEILIFAEKSSIRTIKRPSYLASDKSSSADALEHAVLEIKKDLKPDFIILLQPTSPLRTYKHIDQACKKIIKEQSNSLISVCEIDNKYLKALIGTSEGFLQNYSKDSYSFLDRQSLPLSFLPNGAIYIVRTDNFLKTKTFLHKKTSKFVMDEDSSIDIDSYSDVEKANKRFISLGK